MDIIKRAEVLRKAQDDRKLREALMIKSKKDIYFWINYFVWIREPRVEKGKDPNIPMFIEGRWAFQKKVVDEILEAIEQETDLHIEKSRDMGLSWLMCVIAVWGWNFHRWDSLFGSKNEKVVDTRNDMKTLFPKMRAIIKKMPHWMLPKNFDSDKDMSHLNIYNPETGTSISGEANSANFATGTRCKFIVYDEFAKWEHTDTHAWTSGGAATTCRIANSTPFYKNNKFYQLIDETKGEKNIKRLQVHYSLDTRKDEKWAEREKKRHDPEEWNQEYEISYQGTIFSGVFVREMNEARETGRINNNVEYIPGRDIYAAMDLGMGDATAIVFCQMTRWGEQINLFDCYDNKNQGIDHYIQWMKSPDRVWNQAGNGKYMEGWENIIIVPDPNQATNRELSSGQSVTNIFSNSGFQVETRWIGEQEGISYAKKILKKTRFKSNLSVIESLDSYHYKWDVNRQQYQRRPIHDWSSHYCKAFIYFSAFVEEPEDFAIEEDESWRELNEDAKIVEEWAGASSAGM